MVEDFFECSFIGNYSTTLKKHEQQTLNVWNDISKKLKKCRGLLEGLTSDNQIQANLSESLSVLRALHREQDELEAQVKIEEGLCDMQAMHDLSSQVTQKAAEATMLAQSLKELQTELIDAQYDFKQYKKTLISSLEAMKKAKMTYKHYLDLHVSVLCADKDHIELLINYNKIPLDSNSNSLKLERDLSRDKWKLIEATPPLPNFKELSVMLDKSQDILGLSAFLRPSVRSRFYASQKF